ncbi:MAG: alkaline phosphatase family protein [Ignavibacteriales bacterium]|nr:alkaline phosphatase family protein [Ignavibacteriales bacterium]
MRNFYLLKTIVITFLILSPHTLIQSQNYTILISFDAFRWDYPNRGITPNLDYISQNGVHAISLQPCFPSKTFPNHYSIITGMYPENHGIIANGFTNPATNQTYTLYDTIPRNDPKWYKGEAIWETAKKQGVITASYFWPGAEVWLDYRRPDYSEKYVHKRPYDQRISDVLKWMELPYDQRPKFINVYFDSTDATGHDYGPNSEEVNQSIMVEDSLIGKIFTGLKKLNLLDSTNVIIVSDHGMTELNPDRVININEILKGFNFNTQDKGTMMFIYPDENQKEKVYNKLKASEKNYKVYCKKDLPEHLHYKSNHFVADIVVLADLGYSIFDGKDVEKYSKNFPLGNHGYDPYNLDMHGIFYAIGPDFKSGYTCGTIDNIDIYPLLAKILRIFPNNNIDGKLERIEFLLKDKQE